MLKGENIYLRTLEPGDVDFILQCENDPENWRISQTTVPFSRHLIEKFVESDQDIYKHRQIRFIISYHNNTPVGTLDLFEYDPMNQRAGVGILLLEGYRGKGHAKEALQLIREYAFDHLMLKTLFCNILADNSTSLNLFTSVGFIEIGRKRNWIRTPDGWKDEYLLQLLNSDAEK